MIQIFESKRLICRRWVPQDVDTIFAVYSDEEGARWVDDGSPITYEECEYWLQVTEQNYRTRGYGMFALDDKVSGQTLGFCGLVHPGNQKEAEIKYAFLSSCWGQGYASEAVPKLLLYGAQHHGLSHIIATVASENLASRRVLSKSGMTFTRTIEEGDGSQTLVYEWEASGV